MGDFWATSVLGGKHITNICSKHVLCLVPRCLAKLGKLLGILSPSCWGHLLWIPKESGPGHVTGSLPSLRALSGAQIHMKTMGLGLNTIHIVLTLVQYLSHFTEKLRI